MINPVDSWFHTAVSSFYNSNQGQPEHRFATQEIAKMSKALTEFAQLAQNVKNAPSKFTGAAAEGSRLIPSRTKDALFQFRVDAGRYNDKTKHLNVNLQVNSQAKSPALKDWVKKNTTHGKLATATFDTTAEDKDAEYTRVLNELVKLGKEKLG
ncbi:unnamed protein product [Penicillium salamii]|uniref:Uncharacterized protein n=1 Tax=Penicillium salamii TaxID=1612424 RepID=A0A9W4NBQ9_9EURO|nr:unnamed protein product [Penicillium salamii]CAG7979023.1 unnamed protein product [Penicillium salamii]CAG7982480.1 unnamed protein product [Penicillium salamii]CAG7988008.1 unnamed protein product [Penicillium salamii]CAG8015435.1 unnamed protein product [Penicillium salamii]